MFFFLYLVMYLVIESEQKLNFQRPTRYVSVRISFRMNLDIDPRI